MIMDKLTASEALFGFSAWLTSFNDPIIISSKHDAVRICDAVAEFCKVNELDDPRNHWADNLIQPTSEIR